MNKINESDKNETIKNILKAIRISSTEGGLKIILPAGQGWKKEYGYDYNTGNYWSQGYGHSGYATTGWHDSEATEYTEEEMKKHVSKNYASFRTAYNQIQEAE